MERLYAQLDELNNVETEKATDDGEALAYAQAVRGLVGSARQQSTLGGDGTSRLVHFADELLLGDQAEGSVVLQRLDAQVQPLGETASVAVSLPEHRTSIRSDGAIVWATASGTSVSAVRENLCD